MDRRDDRSGGETRGSGVARATRWALAALAACVAACDPPPLDGPATGVSSRAVETARPAPRSAGFAGLEPEVLDLSGADLARPEVLDRFRVGRDTARQWALGWLSARGELAGPARVCFDLPWLDAGGATVAWEFVLTDLPDCNGWGDLVRHARALRGAGAAVAPGAEELRARTERSARHFFTLAVSAWSFRHPLRDGVKGLPFRWIAFDRLPEALAARGVEPAAVYPLGGAGGLVEAVDYRAGGERVLFSHHAGRVVQPDELRWRFDAAAALGDWRELARRRHADDPSGWIARHAALWLDDLTRGGAP